MHSIEIRRAELNDIDALLPQFNAYRSFYKRQPAHDQARAFITDNISNNRSIIFIAVDTQDNKIVGFTQLYPRLSSLSMTYYMYLSDLYVDEGYRRHAIAKQLMNQAKEYSIAAGAIFIELQTANTNVNAQALYESLNYVLEDEFRTYILALPNAVPSVV